MRAVQLVGPGLPLADAEIAAAEPGPGEVEVGIQAAGICRSDLHYRSGFPPPAGLPRTLGHEIAGVVESTGPGVAVAVGERVCVHYLVTCGECSYCTAGVEQFCRSGRMLGKDIDGGFAESIVVPEHNVFAIPEGVSTRSAAVMMCSTSTVFHALRVGGIAADASVVIFGAGGLGQSAVQLATHSGATVVAVDPNRSKRELATRYGAIAVDPGSDAAAAVRRVLEAGADIALDLVGSASVMRSAIDVLAPMGRAVAVGLTPDTVAVGPYTDLVVGERCVVGSSDHLASEIPELLALAASAAVDIDPLITSTVSLDAAAINGVLDAMAAGSDEVRTVVERVT